MIQSGSNTSSSYGFSFDAAIGGWANFDGFILDPDLIDGAPALASWVETPTELTEVKDFIICSTRDRADTLLGEGRVLSLGEEDEVIRMAVFGKGPLPEWHPFLKLRKNASESQIIVEKIHSLWNAPEFHTYINELIAYLWDKSRLGFQRDVFDILVKISNLAPEGEGKAWTVYEAATLFSPPVFIGDKRWIQPGMDDTKMQA